MPLHLFESVRASGSVPQDWLPDRFSPIKLRIHNEPLLKHLRDLRPGRWRKVLKGGSCGEIHYFEHESGAVAGVKFFPVESLNQRFEKET
jgi:hypothetical protein